MTRRNVYLQNKPWEEALQAFLDELRRAGALDPKEPETVPAPEAIGRITAQPVIARLSAPPFPAAAMDGVAVKADSTYGARETAPRRLRLGEEAIEVDTGDPLPPGFDAVIMAEDLHYPAPEEVEIIAPAAPWQHVRLVGEDIVAGEILLPAYHRITPYDLAHLLAGGATEVAVWPRPRVAIVPTGTELVPVGQPLAPGQLPEFNSHVLAALVEEWGGAAERWPIVPDDYQCLKEAVEAAAASSDVILINAGSSAGREDYTAAVMAELGRIFTHGVAIRPGKPVILGLAAGKPAIGVPGYPVSAVLAAELFVRPLLGAILRYSQPPRPRATAVLTRKLFSPLGAEEFVRLRLGRRNGSLVAVPLARGAGMTRALAQADALLRVPRLSEGYPAGARIEVELLRDPAAIGQTVLCLGSHDLALDLLDSHLRRLFPGESLATGNVGSIGGLLALRRGEAHCAGIHLLDPASGVYNVPYIRRYLPDRTVTLVHLVKRQQGLMVAKGNPLGLAGVADLVRPGVRFVNRQAGAGTRIFLDYLLARHGIEPQAIVGYEREVYTHLAVAVAIASGTADAGMGILAAARAFDLDFLPLGEEDFDLVIPAELWPEERMQHLVAVLRDPLFQAAVAAFEGYRLADCGEMTQVGPEVGGGA
ncbi:MAG: molybdopterin biosynthesis protein [Clostridia bacterium]|nr:molybdopterin biosynthesis protein [Clostridia bacterium]